MEGQGAVALLPELAAQGEGHIVVGGQGVAPHPRLGDQAGGGHVLPVGGGHPPQGRVEVVKDEALVGQLPQGGGALWIQSGGGEALRHDPDQVLPLKIPRPLVFRRGLPLGEPLVGQEQVLVGLVPGQGVEVDVHGVDPRLAPGLKGAGVRGQVVRVHRVGQGGVLVVRVDAEEHPADLQLGLGDHAEVLHLQLGDGGLGVDVPQGEHPAPAQHDDAHGDQLGQDGQQHPPQGPGVGQGLLPHDAPAQEDGQHDGQGHQDHHEPVEEHLARRRVAEGLGHHEHLGDGEQAEEGLEQPVVDGLGAHPEGQQDGGQHQEEPPPPGGDPPAQQPQQQGQGEGKEEGEQRPHRGQGLEAGQLQHDLLIVDDQQEEERGSRQPPPPPPETGPPEKDHVGAPPRMFGPIVLDLAPLVNARPAGGRECGRVFRGGMEELVYITLKSGAGTGKRPRLF